MGRVLLVRHCEVVGPADDAPLTARGSAQAAHLAGWLAGRSVDHVVASPRLRARQTIEPFAAQQGLPLAIDERLAERRLSSAPVADGRSEICAAFVDPDRRLPGGESPREALARCLAAIDAALGSEHALPLLVTHGHLLALVLHSIDGAFDFAGWLSLTNPDVHALAGVPGGPYAVTRLWR